MFIDDKVATGGALKREVKSDLTASLQAFKNLKISLVPVGVGEHARIDELSEIASPKIQPLHFGEYASPFRVGKAIIQGESVFKKPTCTSE